jgi:hypothetical protein
MGKPAGKKLVYLRDADGRGIGQAYIALRPLPCADCQRVVEIGQYFMYRRYQVSQAEVICEPCTGLSIAEISWA